jgi:hypothetical protein
MSKPKKYLVYRLVDGLVVNSIVYDGDSAYPIEDGYAIEPVPAGSFAGIGWVRNSNGDYDEPVEEIAAE